MTLAKRATEATFHLVPRRIFLLVLLAAFSALSAPAAGLEELMRDGLAAETRLEPKRALELYLQADALKPNDPVILQKISKQYSDQVPLQKTDDAKRELATHGLEYAQRAVALAPGNAANVLSLAICHGHLALLSDTRSKVEYSRLIKDECERTLQLEPNYAWAHDILGRWNYEVAAFGRTARFFAKIFYGGIPPASVAEGVAHLQRATELEPGELNHWLNLGHAYAAAGELQAARECWHRGLAMPDRSTHDPAAKERARAALAEADSK